MYLLLSLITICLTIQGAMAMPFDQSIYTHLDEINFSGVALVARDGEIIHHQAYGFSDYENQIPNTVETVFPFASVTKPLMAAGLLQQMEMKKTFSLQSKLRDFIDYNFLVEPTFEDLLHHTSNLALYTDFTKEDPNRQNPLADEDLYQLLTPHSAFSTEASFNYNNGNYILLGHVLRKIVGKDYKEYFAEEFFFPLKMRQAKFVEKTQAFPTYGYFATQQEIVKAPSIDGSWLGGGAGMMGTANDLYLFMQGYEKGEIISPEMAQLMRQPTHFNYGLGWTLDGGKENAAFYHEGGISGFSTILFNDPQQKLTVIALSNIETNIEKIARHLVTLASASTFIKINE